jgi:teichuronic acid biosynthesis glycosyltransferase TuaG
MNNQISVIIPTYNRSKELLRAVNSVLNQTTQVLEILICDDGSTDDSYPLIKSLDNPLIIWINCGRNGNAAVPRNIGIKNAKGNWVAFLDSDDEWLPFKLEYQINLILSNNASAVSSNAININVKTKEFRSYFNKEFRYFNFSKLLYSNYVITSSVLIKKNLLLKYKLFPENVDFIGIEDYALWLKISTNDNFFYSNESLLNYYSDHSNSLSSKCFLDLNQIRKKVLIHLISIFKCENLHLTIKQNLYIYFYLSDIVTFKYFIFRNLKSLLKY